MKKLLLTLSFIALSLQTGRSEEYRFSSEGRPLDDLVLPVTSNRKGSIKAGDIAQFYSFTFVVGEPGSYELRHERDEVEKLFCKFNGGPERCIGLEVKKVYIDDQITLIDPLSRLPPEEKKHLRSVILSDRPANWDQALSGIDWEQCAVSLGGDSTDPAAPHRMPQLPAEVAYLTFDFSNSDEITDVSPLAKLDQLRFLDLGYCLTLKGGELQNKPKLVHLIADYIAFENAADLASLSAMKFLKIREAEGIKSPDFANQMPELRVLKIDRTAVSDISKLTCPKLRLLSAIHTNIEALPSPENVPVLKDLRILSTPAGQDPELVASFQKSLQGCTIAATWMQSLRSKIEGANKLRVRSGGTCHRRPDEEETLFELTDVDKIRSLIAGLQVIDDRSGFSCMCCGEPTIEVYKEDVLIASIGFHHGHSLRWSDGLWPGDAAMTEESSRHLCKFLADHGHDGPLQEFEEGLARDRAGNRFASSLSEIAPDAFYSDWWKTISGEDQSPSSDSELQDPDDHLRNLVASQWPDKNHRAKNLFAIYGALPDGSWNLSLAFDDSLRESLLPELSTKINDLLTSKDINEQTLQGIARWCLFDREGSNSRKALTEDNRSLLIKWGLAHPREANRIETLLTLDEDGQLDSILTYFSAPPKARELPPEHEIEPGGSVMYLPREKEIPSNASSRAVAAVLLAHSGMESISAQLTHLRSESDGRDAEAYQLALELLDAAEK